MNTLTTDDMQFLLGRMPRDLLALLKKEDISLAGGAIRASVAKEKINDYDIFGADADNLVRVAKDLALSRKGRCHHTANANTVLAPSYTPVQFITRWCYQTPENVIHSFDFTICQAVVWYDKAENAWRSRCSERFYADLAAKRLSYTATVRNEDAGGSILRAFKFASRGFSISPEDLGAVLARLASGVNAEAEFWLGDEEWKALVLTGLLREVDPMTVIDGLDVAEAEANQEEGMPV